MSSLRAVANNSSTFLHPSLCKRILDRLRRLFRGLRLSSNCGCFVVKEPTRIRPKELIHRNSDPVRSAYLLSKLLKEGALKRVARPLHHRDDKALAARFAWTSLLSQTFIKSTVSLGASFDTNHPSKLAKMSLALPLPPLTSGKKNQPSFSSGSLCLVAELRVPTSKSQSPIRWKAALPSWKPPAASGYLAAWKPFWKGSRSHNSLYIVHALTTSGPANPPFSPL